jgi:hypothetical protein
LIRTRRWTGQYAQCFVTFALTGTLLLYGFLRLQPYLPWFSASYISTPMTPDLAMNIGISFSTTTTWQAYAGESALSYFSQIVGLMVQDDDLDYLRVEFFPGTDAGADPRASTEILILRPARSGIQPKAR